MALPTVVQGAPWTWASLADANGVALTAAGFNNASVGTIGSAIPTSATLIGVADGSGNLEELTTDANDNLKVTLFGASGTALAADQTNTELRTSMYATLSTAGDTAVASTANGSIFTQISAVKSGISAANGVPVFFSPPAGTAGDVSATGTNATVTATLAAVAAKSWYLTGFTITALLSTALGSGDITISGLQNTLTMEMVTDDTTLGATETVIVVTFPVPRPASANNTAVSVSVAALGANTGKVAVTIHGQNF